MLYTTVRKELSKECYDISAKLFVSYTINVLYHILTLISLLFIFVTLLIKNYSKGESINSRSIYHKEDVSRAIVFSKSKISLFNWIIKFIIIIALKLVFISNKF